MNRVLALIIAACCFATPFIAYAEEAKSEAKSDKVLAIVGDEKITEADLYAKISMLPPQFRARYETPEGQKNLLEQTIKFSLLAQEARKQGIDKRDDVAKKIKEIADNIIIQEFTKNAIIDKIMVTDEEIKDHFKKNRDDFTKPEKIKARLILFESPDNADQKIKKEKEEKARETLTKLKKGADFEELAKELSDDKRTQKRGGNTGFFSKGKREGTYGEKFEEIAFSLKPGATSDVFESKGGLYIVQVVEKKDKKEETLEEVKERIERKLKQDKQKEAYENFLEELKKKYKVKML
jgi:peptidyl-prolyl cis-trans isomerase C